jgi:hypothetical protein
MQKKIQIIVKNISPKATLQQQALDQLKLEGIKKSL